jgi:hypothetical protein
MVDGTPEPEKEREQYINKYIADNAQYDGLVITIEDDTADSMWAEFFAEINTKRKEREKWFEDIKTPLNAALKILNAQEHLAIDRLKEIEYTITQARGSWMQAKNKAVKDANTQALTEAAESGGVAIIQPKASKSVHTAAGAAVGLKTLQSWRLTDDNNITAKVVADDKLKLDRADPRLKNVPDKLFVLQPGLIAAALKMGDIPEGEHSIEKCEVFSSTNK